MSPTAFVSPITRSVARLVKAMSRPSSEIEGSDDAARTCAPVDVTLTRVVS
jgi:hypothetical protein